MAMCCALRKRECLANADLVIWVGPSLESFLEKPLATLASQAHQLELVKALAGQLLPLREGGSWDVHQHELGFADQSAD